MSEIKTDDGEASIVEQIAAQRREQEANRPEKILPALRKHRRDLSAMQADAFQSVRHTILDVDARGKVVSRSGAGTPTDYSANALVKSNLASRRQRIERIREIIKDLDQRIENLERGKPVDGGFDLKKFIEQNLSSMPDNDVMIVIQSPQGEAAKGKVGKH
jgi:hypothetical protein